MDTRQMGSFIKALRKEKDLTQEQLGEALYVSSRTVSRWETGNNLPDLVMLQNIAEFFQVDIRELIDGQRREVSKEPIDGRRREDGTAQLPNASALPETGGETKEEEGKEAEPMEKETVQKLNEYSSTKEKRISKKMLLIFLLVLLALGGAALGIFLAHRGKELDKVQTEYIVGRRIYAEGPLEPPYSIILFDDEHVDIARIRVTSDTRISDSLNNKMHSMDIDLVLVAQVSYTESAKQAAAQKGESFVYTALSVDEADQGVSYDREPLPTESLSAQLSADLKELWAVWDGKTPMEQAASSTMPGSLHKFFVTWEEAGTYLGYAPWNPLESSKEFARKNYVGTDSKRDEDGVIRERSSFGFSLSESAASSSSGNIEEYIAYAMTNPQHVEFTCSGERDGKVNYAGITAGYAAENARVLFTAELLMRTHTVGTVSEEIALSPTVTAQVCRDSGTYYDAIRLYFTKDSVFYTVEIICNAAPMDPQLALEKVLTVLKEALS